MTSAASVLLPGMGTRGHALEEHLLGHVAFVTHVISFGCEDDSEDGRQDGAMGRPVTLFGGETLRPTGG